jgi:NAD/NADP transhydrogenase beta subunit
MCGGGQAIRAREYTPSPSSRLPPVRIIRSPAQRYALVIGLSLTAAGIVGFFYSGAFASPGKVRDVFGVLGVNGWHNLVHIATGLVGLAVWRSYGGARRYAIGLGVVYTVVGIWGFTLGSSGAILGFLPVNSEDDVLHLLIALGGLFAGVLTPATPEPSGEDAEPGTSFRELRT